MFDVHLFIDAKLNMKLYSKFFLRSDWPFFRPEAALNPARGGEAEGEDSNLRALNL